MSVECTSCGHLIPAGQFRCGKCGSLSPRQSMEDFAGLTEVAVDALVPAELGASPTQVEPSAPDAHEGEREAVVAKTPADSAGEAVVPKGTFASETPRALAVSTRSADSVSEELRARQPSEPMPPRSPAASTSQRIVAQARVVTRPPFLASESLREDLSPREPGQRSLKRTLQGAGASGFLASALVAFDDQVGWLCAALCAALIALSRLKLAYPQRAKLVMALSGIALPIMVALRRAGGAGRDEAVLVAACALLPAALWFRSWYRSARVARIGVASALCLALFWCALTSHRGLLALEFSWQSWAPALTWYVFGILCLLSLLAFMGDETTGGCHAWAIGISTWFGLYACLRWALERGVLGAPSAGVRLGSASGAALGLVEAALAAAFALALAQGSAVWFVRRSRVIPRAS